MNAGFSNVCEIFKVRGIESLKYIRECYCGDISTPRNMTLNETNCDWLVDMSVKGPHGRGLTNELVLSVSDTESVSLSICRLSFSKSAAAPECMLFSLSPVNLCLKQRRTLLQFESVLPAVGEASDRHFLSDGLHFLC